MFWTGILIGAMIGGTLVTFIYCIIMIGKETDSNEYFDEHTIK